jgi:hypothetical protein
MATNRHPDDLLTSRQLADVLHVSHRTPEVWRANGSGPPYNRPGGKVCLYRWGDVVAWLERSKATSTAEEAA